MATRRTHRERSPDVEEALTRLRRLVRSYGNVNETPTFGNPTFKVGRRAFAVLDCYRGVACLWLRIDPFERATLLAQKGWFAAPYDPRQQALCVDLAAIDWRRIRPLLRMSYWLASA